MSVIGTGGAAIRYPAIDYPMMTMTGGFGIERMILSAPLAEPLDYRAGLLTLIDTAGPDIGELIVTGSGS